MTGAGTRFPRGYVDFQRSTAEGDVLMPESELGGEHKYWQSHPIPEIDILWITAGLGCDGDRKSVV
jgi:hypothetical protein